MRKKHAVPFSQKFRNTDPLALRLLERLLAFDPKDRPSAEEVSSRESIASFPNLKSSFFFLKKKTFRKHTFFICYILFQFSGFG